MNTEGEMLEEARRVAKLSTRASPESFFKTETMWSEFKILDRLIYKYNNQQRRHVHFRRMKLLRRRMQRIYALERWTMWAVVEKNEGDPGLCTRGLDLLIEIIKRAREDCKAAYEALYAVLLDTLYVPFAVCCSAIIARMFVCLERLLRIAMAVRLELHMKPLDELELQPTTVASTSPEKKVPQMERMEAGWEHSTAGQKAKKYTKKVKRSADEIDDIFIGK